MTADPAGAENGRVSREHLHRASQFEASRFAPWSPAFRLWHAERLALAARMLHRKGVFPRPGDACLEVGYGTVGWLADLLGWGLRLEDLHGIELVDSRANVARRAFPGADLRVGDATRMPWGEGRFRLTIASTVFTSVLDGDVRRRLADEIVRVLAPGGALLWYDFRVDNPRNRQVRGVRRRELRSLFCDLSGEIRSLSLAPPLAYRIAPASPWLAATLAVVPALRTHLMAVLIKR